MTLLFGYLEYLTELEQERKSKAVYLKLTEALRIALEAKETENAMTEAANNEQNEFFSTIDGNYVFLLW